MQPIVGAGIVATQRLEDDERVSIGGREWRVITGQGHAPEHMCLYCPDLRVMFTGDHILAVLAKLILEGRFGPKDVIPVDVEGGEFVFSRVVH